MGSILERLESLVGQAEDELLLVAPFIKYQALDHLLRLCGERVSVRCVTRWRAEEVWRGVSDLDVFGLLSAKDNAQLLLRHDLHAKFFRGDSTCLIGSANLTGRALGLTSPSNFELLVASPSDTEVLVRFERELLEACVPASQSIRNSVSTAVDRLGPYLREGVDAKSGSDLRSGLGSFGTWLPRCTVPQQLFSVYQGDRSILPRHTFEDASDDLEIMSIPPRLNASAFRSLVASRLVQHPVVGLFATAASEDSLAQARAVLESVVESSSDFESAFEAEEIIGDWLNVFLPMRSANRSKNSDTREPL